jgi:hypothetical protein
MECNRQRRELVSRWKTIILAAWQRNLPVQSEGRVPRAPNQKSRQRSQGVVELHPPKHVKNPPSSSTPASFIAATIWNKRSHKVIVALTV